MGMNGDSGGSMPDDAHIIAVDFSKQIITLASGVLALSATFLPKLTSVPLASLIFLVLSWGTLTLSVYYGLNTISVIIKSRITSDDDWAEGEGQSSASNSKTLFFLGIIFFSVFAFLVLTTPSASQTAPSVTQSPSTLTP
jgi:hypothetical protein